MDAGWIMNWWWATVLGPIVLGAAIAYALLTRRRLTPREKTAQKQAIEEVYKDEPTRGPDDVRKK